MNYDWISYLLFILIPAVALAIYAINNRPQEVTGPATVVSHRMELGKWGSAYSDNWNRMVTFRLSDGNELELFVSQAEYLELADGMSGQLTWDKDMLVYFDPDRTS